MPENNYFPGILLDAGISGVAKRFNNEDNEIAEFQIESVSVIPTHPKKEISFFLKDQKANIPVRATEHAAGYDLSAHSLDFTEDGFIVKIGTGVHFSIPVGHVGVLVPRSSIYKKGLLLANSVGIIDADYRGEVIFVYRSANGEKLDSNYISTLLGERIGQIVFLQLPQFSMYEVDSLDELGKTERGEGGFGSTGLK